ncbi:MAG: hypothetical protein CM1200mP29_08310 [Verrucomicrobiota bacterium]|nr:MAG: hypothetical protein CM1200mP29_08310 [Verrucomicrobiota bacterium]
MRTNANLGAISDDQWKTLQSVGDLDVPSIGFRRGSATISLSGEHELKRLKKMLDSFPSFYLRVVGQARPWEIPRPTVDWPVRAPSLSSISSIPRGSMRIESAPRPPRAASRSGSAQSVRFELGQVPY